MLAAQELSELELLQFSLTTQRARLLAEIRDEPLDTPAIPTPSSDAYAEVVENEVSLFEANNRAKQAEMEALRARQARTDDEIKSLRESIELHDEEVRISEEELKVQAGLVERGLSAQSKLNDFRREVGRIRREALDFRTELFRAQQTRLLTEHEVTNIDMESDKENLARLSEVVLELNQTTLKLERARRVVENLRTATTASQKALGRRVNYMLFRLAGRTYQDGVTVDEFTQLQRGDIIRVTPADAKVKEAGHLAQADPGPPAEAGK
jgi:polysaccharide export outer membrane protein